MKKLDIVKKMAEKLSIKQEDSKVIVEAFSSTIKDAILSDDPIHYHGLGTLKVVKRKARRGVDIRTKSIITVPSFKEPKFFMSAELKKKLNR